MFNRSRRNLASWFTLAMGGILVVFAAAVYYVKVIDELEELDQLLYKKTTVMAASVRTDLDNRQRRVDLDKVPLLGTKVEPLSDSQLVYAGWYDEQKRLVQFFGETPSDRLLVASGFNTIKIHRELWLRRVTLPVYQDGLLIGYMQAAMPLTETEGALAEFRLVLAISVPITLGIIALTGWWLGGVAMQPIRQSYDYLQRFTADASHELRSPLSAIVSNAQYGLLTKSTDPETQRQRLQKIFDIAQSMSILVNDLLFLARYQGRIPIESLQTVDLKILLLQIQDDFLPHPETQHIKLLFTLPNHHVSVLGDANLLRQAVINLLSNACKYTPEGGQVELQLFTQSNWAVIQVVDNGIGIPQDDVPYIFERFYRVDKKRSRKTGGFGLGLAITQQIIQSHGGKINVHSAVNQGATFQVLLPLK
ncbi:sensor histidine kinase [Anabaena sp. FACHB-709]|uniref:histidine kinase n=2 Tax=Nostocaceae TaxID=1162 RepID=A0A1Z4KIH7_ANAVA|nr:MULTISPECIES: ATP-binding protein [Nostocaceae]BAY68791.1 two-component sensor histidine kinase [Trichormus variabilis NIES-23]HBW33565.1 two-component sensor histidine kinase [Nostoc sp. UBA8866]MBD2170369.1 two-component sensor histidine kinase [Anabaena cylindrica FACHB-318]MBD2262154.1 two-component sensor histidine kinase [Anabaena sp. FACHB-709]MBD2271702.1 two-component sensor histidine kinase [Nostoc sp. PCC 7120 = FACHB-418]